MRTGEDGRASIEDQNPNWQPRAAAATRADIESKVKIPTLTAKSAVKDGATTIQEFHKKADSSPLKRIRNDKVESAGWTPAADGIKIKVKIPP